MAPATEAGGGQGVGKMKIQKDDLECGFGKNALGIILRHPNGDFQLV